MPLENICDCEHIHWKQMLYMYKLNNMCLYTLEINMLSIYIFTSAFVCYRLINIYKVHDF